MTSPIVTPAAVARRRILYVSTFTSPGTTTFRYEAMRRIGQDVVPFEFRKYEPRSGPLRIFRSRFPFGPLVSKINQDLLSALKASRPDVVWFDKPTLFTRETMEAIHTAGARIVFYVQDGPSARARMAYGGSFIGFTEWRTFIALCAKPMSLAIVRGDCPSSRRCSASIRQCSTLLRKAGRTRRDRGISYIGHPHEERPAFLRTLAKQYNLPLSINGNFWRENSRR